MPLPVSHRRLLPKDPRWIPFCRRFAPDIVRFMIEVVGLKPTAQQINVLRSLAISRSRTSVASGHGTGKTALTSVTVLWHLLCYPMSVTLITANDLAQLKATVWKEIGTNLERIRSNANYGWIAEYVTILASARLKIKGFDDTWFVESKTANAKTANKLAGRHGKWLLLIADEASTIADEVLITLTGALTDSHNRMLMNSQPTRNAGYFFRSHNDLSMVNGGEWNSIVLSSINSPLVADAALVELWNSYDEDERNVRILGIFPQNSSKHMMNLKTSMSMYDNGRIIDDDEPYGFLVLSDIASGEGLRDSSSIICARVIGYGDYGPDARRVEIFEIPLFTNEIKSNVIAGHIMEAGGTLQGHIKVVDSGGLGIVVCQDLEDLGQHVHRVNWGSPCFMAKNKERYLNLRAQASHHAAIAAKNKRISILTPKYKKSMLKQSSSIPKLFNDKSKIKVPPKGSYEWDGLGSPDLWDAVCFAFLENVVYVPVEHIGVNSLTTRLEIEAEEAFSGID